MRCWRKTKPPDASLAASIPLKCFLHRFPLSAKLASKEKSSSQRGRVFVQSQQPHIAPQQNPSLYGHTAPGETDYQYAGLFLHPTSALNLSATRPMDGVTGRWLNRDLIREPGGINLYAYVGASPVENIDSDGMCADKNCTEDQLKASAPKEHVPGNGSTACPEHTLMSCVAEAPYIGGTAGAPTNNVPYEADRNYGGYGLHNGTKWMRYVCTYMTDDKGRQFCTFIAPGVGENGHGVETMPYCYDGVCGTVPVTVNPFPVDPDHPTGDVDDPFIKAMRNNYQCLPPDVDPKPSPPTPETTKGQ